MVNTSGYKCHLNFLRPNNAQLNISLIPICCPSLFLEISNISFCDYGEFSEYNGKKRARVESAVLCSGSPESKRVRDDVGESEVGSPEADKIRADLLDILDDLDVVTDPDQDIQGLESVMKSFENEIVLPPAVEVAPASRLVASQTGLDYLLEASDDDLWLPPTAVTSDVEEEAAGSVDLLGIASDAAQFDELLWLGDEILSNGSFPFGLAKATQTYNFDADLVALDGLFDHSSECSDTSDFLSLPPSLHALW
ncbi:hypothetical protein Nepgr_005783 [Nepenthes gracilis]|uniref:Uncharacterized protein n=1 Tax=Nepenthes gracilis TaxID=150966 RepID=A0AAD3XGQ1_NEPGR|nr:hypothetical protein Nepgr_005783 [Nepenthes gracilis]